MERSHSFVTTRRLLHKPSLQRRPGTLVQRLFSPFSALRVLAGLLLALAPISLRAAQVLTPEAFAGSDFDSATSTPFAVVPQANHLRISSSSSFLAHAHESSVTAEIQLLNADTGGWVTVHSLRVELDHAAYYDGLNISFPPINTTQLRFVSNPPQNQTFHYFNEGTTITLTSDVPAAPQAITDAATAVSSTGATLRGRVTSNTLTTDAVFQYSIDPTFTNGVTTTSPAATLPGAAVNSAVSAAVAGLTEGVTYYFRVVANNSAGSATGAILPFFTSDLQPAYQFEDDPEPSNYFTGGATFGSEFNVVAACKVTHLGVYDFGRDDLAADTPVALWDQDGNLLATTVVLKSDRLVGNFRYHELATPVNLAANRHYIVGAFVDSSDLITGWVPAMAADPRIQYVQQLMDFSGFVFPTSSASYESPAFFGANFAIGSADPAPTADAGLDQTTSEGSFVILDGTASRDTNSPPKPLTYAWTQLSGPSVSLANADTATPSFITPAVPAGGAALVFQLTVSNGREASDIVAVNVANGNNLPVANAGADQTVGENTLVTLDGSQSSDADGDALTLHWMQVPGFGPTVTLVDADAINPTFIAPEVTAEQGTIDLRFQLVANDGKVSSGPATVIVHVRNTNDAPTANAGRSQSVNELDMVTLHGTLSSDPDGNALTYSWKQILGTPLVTLNGADSSTPSFQAPALNIGGLTGGTTLTFELTVNDGTLSSVSAVNVRVSNVNHAPLADAGIDQTVPSNALVALSGASSADTDGDPLTYAWFQTGGPSVTLSGTDTAGISFTAPLVGPAGDVVVLLLTVNDGYGGVASDEVVVNVTFFNRPPTASAGAPQTVTEGTVAMLAGSASDPDGNDLSIKWSQVGGPAVNLTNSGTLSPSFTAPLVTRTGDNVVLRLTVDDGYGGVASSDVTMRIANANSAPIAQAPANLSAREGTLVSLIGQGADADSEEQSALVYAWQQTAGPHVTLVGSGATVAFTTPLISADGGASASATLAFRLTVTDPNGATGTDDVTVVVTPVDHAPIAIAGGNLTVNEGASLTLNGSASSDPDHDALTFSWVQIAGPVVRLFEAQTAYPYFTAPFVTAAGTILKFKLTVTDGAGGTSSDLATVSVININDPPSVQNAQPSIATLWPPNHSMIKISILGVFDPNNNAAIKVTRVTQDEPTNGQGDGDTAIDAIINADGTVLLRAERSGSGDGRVYRVYFTASDAEGSASGMVKVSVPKSKKTTAAIDGGGVFISTQ